MMSNIIYKNRFLLSRRIVQIGLMVLFAGANYYGWKILTGNLTSASFLEAIPFNDPFAAMQMLAAGFLISSDILIGGLIVLGFYALIGGRSFCSWVCPMNIVADLAIWIRRKLKLKSNFDSQGIGRKARYIFFGLSIILSIMFGISAFEAISPVSILHRGIIYGFGIGWVVVLAVLFFDLLILKFGWCGHLCPLGAFYSLTSRYNLIKVKHNESNCTNCLKCKIACPEEQVLNRINVSSGFVFSGECTNCGRCIEVCNDNAMKFSIYNYKK